MANRILKGLAVAAGTGLAMGLTSARTGRARVRVGPFEPVSPVESSRAANSPLPAEPDDEFLNIEPLLDRLERVEARVEWIGQHHPPVPDSYAAAIADLERRVEENTRELALLRESVTAAERHATESVASVQRSVDEARAEIPAVVEQQVTTRVDQLQIRFAAEIEQSHQRTMEMFDRAIDEKISSRIGLLERALAEQAGSIEALSARTSETDSNLQRLVLAIEKLCERAQLIAPLPEPQVARHYETRLPFESQMQDAMRREPVVPIVRTAEVIEASVPAPAFAASVAPKKSRFLFRNLIVAAFSLVASRMFR